MKVLIIGENPHNKSGFGNLTHYIATIFKNNNIDFKVLSVLSGQSGYPHELNYTVLQSESIGQKIAKDLDMYGAISSAKVLLDEKDYTDVLLTGDPWMHEIIYILKPLFPNIKFHSYTPVEGETLTDDISNAFSVLNEKHEVSISGVLKNIDNVIAYSKTGKDALNKLVPNICSKYVYHSIIPPDISTQKPIENLDKHIDGKFVIGTISRNSMRKSVDSLLILASMLAEDDRFTPADVIIIAHIPKHDTRGFNITNILKQLHPDTDKYISFTEEINNNIFIKKINNQVVYDVKNALSDHQLNYLYSKFDLYISLSRAEGFGFPIIEAPIHGVPVICNGFATPRELLHEMGTPELAIPYAAKIFVEKGNDSSFSVPDIKSFIDPIYKLMKDNQYHKEVINKQRKYVEDNLCIGSNSKLESLIELISCDIETKESNIVMIDSHMERCGIRTYTNNICEHLPNISRYKIKNIRPITELASHITSKVFHIQYEPNLRDRDKVIELISKLRVAGNKVVVTLHTIDHAFMEQTNGIVNTFITHGDLDDKAKQCIHASEHIKSIHPIPKYDIAEQRTQLRKKMNIKRKDIVIGLNGFILPYKKISEQAHYVLQMMKENPEFHLAIVGSPHASDNSGVGKNILLSIKKHAEAFGVVDRIHITYEFMDKHKMAISLSVMDFALVYHNMTSVGAQSGSIRELIGCNVIPICTKSNTKTMHNDLIASKCAIGLSGKDGQDLSVEQFSQTACAVLYNIAKGNDKDGVIDSAHEAMRQYMQDNSFKNFAELHSKIYDKI